MEIWQFNDSEPLRPFLVVLEKEAPDLAVLPRRLLTTDEAGGRGDLARLARGLMHNSAAVRQDVP